MLTPGTNPFDGSIFLSTNSDAAGGHARRSTITIDASFFDRPAAEVAKDLIGKILESRIDGKNVSGIIVETVAYTGEGDSQSHNYKVCKGQQVDWQAGALYIYSTQGHTMLTVTTAPFKEGSTVLIRALEPLGGVDEMLERFGAGAAKDILNTLTKGPGKLSKALGITPDYNGHNMLGERAEIGIFPGFELPADQIRSSKRKGDTPGIAENLRFFRAENEWVS